MNEHWAQQLRDFLSTERLSPYVSRCGGDTLAALRFYAWNIEISAALQGPLAILEVVLRNALHSRLTDYAGRPDWWNARPGNLLGGREAEKVGQARRALAVRNGSQEPGRMVAELSFGFWGGLLGRRYEVNLWRPVLHTAFPGFSGERSRLHTDVYHLRKLRNRIAHHEPIHHRHLAADYESIIRTINYIAPDISAWVRHNDRVTDVLARRAQVCAGTAPTRF